MELTVRRTVVMAIVTVAIIAGSFTTYAYDPSPLQNFCVADNNASVCKDPKLVTVDDFLFSGLQIAVSTKNPFGFAANIVNIDKLPGFNTLGMSIARGDFGPNGVTPIHLHPRATELILVLEGTVYAGFVDSTPGTKSKVFTKILKDGDLFVFPIGLIHFTRNVGNTSATVMAFFNSQDDGFVRNGADVFGTEQPIPADLLAKAFQLDNKTVKHLQSISWT